MKASPSSSSFSFKEKLQYTLIGVVVLGGTFFLGRSIVRKAASTSEQKKSFEEGNPATYAQQIRMAFENNGWWGSDIPALRQVLHNIPNTATFKKVINSYQRLYNRSLMADMKKDLKTTEYNEMIAILSAKPARANTGQTLSLKQYQSWSERLKAAFDIKYGPIPGTDEGAIKSVFMEIPTQRAFAQLCAVYKSMYGTDLIADLHSELWSWDFTPYMKIIGNKPKS